MTLSPDRIPVLIGAANVTDRPATIAEAREPLALMQAALAAALKDAGGEKNLLSLIDSIDVVNLVSWPYTAPADLLCERLGIKPARCEYGVVGGETPVKMLHEAARRIALGESHCAVILSAESQNSVDKARRAGETLNWTDPSPTPQNPLGRMDYMNQAAIDMEVFLPVAVYPFYESATAALWGQTPREALAETGALWAQYSAAAATHPESWISQTLSADDITTVSESNRLIAWPYTKLMVANPSVNQGAAVIVTSLALAREAGIAEDRLIYVHGGAAAMEPRDYLARDVFNRSVAQEEVLKTAQKLAPAAFSAVELYSCFPCVPKMARRILGLGEEVAPTVTGGLTFFGAPLNGYMNHAAVCMLQHLRAQPGTGLLYGQGEFVTKHHALVLSSEAPANDSITQDYSVQAQADAARGKVPPLATNVCDCVTIEAYTILFERDGQPKQAVVIAIDDNDQRCVSRVLAADSDAISRLMDLDLSMIGERGEVAPGKGGLLEFRLT